MTCSAAVLCDWAALQPPGDCQQQRLTCITSFSQLPQLAGSPDDMPQQIRTVPGEDACLGLLLTATSHTNEHGWVLTVSRLLVR